MKPSQTGRDEERVSYVSIEKLPLHKRLLSVKQETAMLTTFNEVDMQPIKDLRAKVWSKSLKKQHGVKAWVLWVSLFWPAVQALKKFPIS